MLLSAVPLYASISFGSKIVAGTAQLYVADSPRYRIFLFCTRPRLINLSVSSPPCSSCLQAGEHRCLTNCRTSTANWQRYVDRTYRTGVECFALLTWLEMGSGELRQLFRFRSRSRSLNKNYIFNRPAVYYIVALRNPRINCCYNKAQQDQHFTTIIDTATAYSICVLCCTCI